MTQALTGSRHPEFVPLMLRGSAFRRLPLPTAVGHRYDSFPDPATGFEHLFQLLRTDRGVYHRFAYWATEERRYRNYRFEIQALADIRAGKRRLAGEWDLTDTSYDLAKAEVEHWYNSRVHPNSRLTPDQHARIQSLEDVWVRTAYWLHFPEWCSPFWMTRLYANLKRAAEPPAEAIVATIGKNLASDRFAVRERRPPRRYECTRELSQPSAITFGTIRRRSWRTGTGHCPALRAKPSPPLAERVIESAVYCGQFQGVLIFQALTGPTARGRLADFARDRLPEQQERFCVGEASRWGWERDQPGR